MAAPMRHLDDVEPRLESAGGEPAGGLSVATSFASSNQRRRAARSRHSVWLTGGRDAQWPIGLLAADDDPAIWTAFKERQCQTPLRPHQTSPYGVLPCGKRRLRLIKPHTYSTPLDLGIALSKPCPPEARSSMPAR
jgi:hypothetical protein